MLIVFCCVLYTSLCLTAITLRLRHLESLALRHSVKRENRLALVRLKVLRHQEIQPPDVDIHWDLHPILNGV